MTCVSCVHSYSFTVDGKTSTVCRLRGYWCNPCELYNKDVSDMNVCYNCKNYLKGTEYGESCDADFYTLTTPLSSACRHFVKKGE